jgi:hypothetical protein
LRTLLGEPAAWYLLSDDGQLYLDVNCTQPAVSYDVLIQLDEAERAAFEERGRDFADELATRIADSPRSYWGRNVTGPVTAFVTEAILAYQRETGTGPPAG